MSGDIGGGGTYVLVLGCLYSYMWGICRSGGGLVRWQMEVRVWVIVVGVCVGSVVAVGEEVVSVGSRW